MFEINFCLCGRFESEFTAKNSVALGSGDMSVSMFDGSCCAETYSSFPLGYYEGITIMVESDTATEWMRRHAGVLAVDISQLKGTLLRHNWFWVSSAGPRCEHIFRELYECISYSDHTYLELKIIELFMLLMKKTVTEISDDYYPKSQIDVVKHIRDHLVSQLTAGSQLGTLIAKHNISVSQFRKAFRAIYGKPVCRYLTEYRLEQAAIELSTSDKPITEIAYALGFSSPSKFTEHFRKCYGVTPTHYRSFGKSEAKSDSSDKCGQKCSKANAIIAGG